MIIDFSRIEFDNKIRKDNKVKIISGSDEAGRGAMAGPVVVASVILAKDYQNPLINDSKKISSKVRDQLFDEIYKKAIDVKVEIINANEVDILNPKAASKLGMINSIKKLKITPELSLIDAEKLNDKDINSLAIIKGDNFSQSIAAASIIAKVTRDRIMIKYSQEYPGYNFDKHKGYCTQNHMEIVKEKGILPIHRKSYKPIKLVSK